MWGKIRELICRQANLYHLPNTDDDYLEIQLSIEENTENNISLNINTIKNIFDHWGKGVHEPSKKTKNTISEYLGFSDWNNLTENIDSFYKFITQNNKRFIRKNLSAFICKDLDNLGYGEEIIIQYSSGRILKLKVLENDRTKVLPSLNSSVVIGDEVTLKYLQTYQNKNIG